MPSQAAFTEIAALAGDPARAAMLHALLGGRALTAGELAATAGITPPTASGHLARLVEAGLLQPARQGRHRYYRLATPSVARMLEGIMQLAAELQPQRPALRTGPRDAALRRARTCYDHFAGRLGVALADALVAAGHVELADEAGLVTPSGTNFLAGFGGALADIAARPGGRGVRVLCRPCLDWSERRPHLAGALGAALCGHAMAAGWTRRAVSGRAVLVTHEGERVFRERFGARLD